MVVSCGLVVACLCFPSSLLFFLFVARVVLGEKLVLVVPQVGCVDDLVEVFFRFFLLLEWIRGCPVVAEVVCSAVGSVNHKGGFEEVLLAGEVGRESPNVQGVPVVVVKLHPSGRPFSGNSASGVVFK